MPRGYRHTRRDILKFGAGLAASACLPGAHAQPPAAALLTRAIPRAGEKLPVIGLGTAIVFDIDDDMEKRTERTRVIETLIAGGARLIDTAPSYGTAETVVGDLVANLKARSKVFLATKVRARSNDAFVTQMKQSQQRLRSDSIDLMQMHNVGFIDRAQFASQLALVREWKQQGVFRYIGVTHSQSQASANERLMEILHNDKLDFIQVNYSMAERSVEDKLLAVAAQTGTAVLCNLPFGRGSLFRAVKGKTVPAWAKAEFDAATWGQFFLKYLLANEAINGVLPGTDKVEYMLDNLGAARGRLPNAAQRKRMVELLNSI